MQALKVTEICKAGPGFSRWRIIAPFTLLSLREDLPGHRLSADVIISVKEQSVGMLAW